ncbi:hypothetical protein ACFRLW_45175 [Streptomyces sp. NPDC056728]
MADQAVVDSRPHGVGSLEAMSTEVGLLVTSTDAEPGYGLVLADLVVAADGVLNRAVVVMNLVDSLKLPFPVISTTLTRLYERGPWGQTWWKASCGGSSQSLDLPASLTV